MELWFTEKQTENLGLSIKVKETLYRERSEYQDILIVESLQFGRTLLLDGIFQTTEKDEFFYHEMLTHVGLSAHPEPRTVLIIGGGDGGTVRETLKHSSVEQVVLVEIDGKVIEASKKYLPLISSCLDDPKVKVVVTDGIKYLKKTTESFDVILIDSTDPIGPAVGLFEHEFYSSANKALNPDGFLVAQTESPFLNTDLIVRVNRTLSEIFPTVKVYLAPVPTYPTGYWSFTIASKTHDPSIPRRQIEGPTRYYNQDIHRASFSLPSFLKDALRLIS